MLWDAHALYLPGAVLAPAVPAACCAASPLLLRLKKCSQGETVPPASPGQGLGFPPSALQALMSINYLILGRVRTASGSILWADTGDAEGLTLQGVYTHQALAWAQSHKARYLPECIGAFPACKPDFKNMFDFNLLDPLHAIAWRLEKQRRQTVCASFW